MKVLSKEKNGSSACRAAVGRTKRNKRNKERLKVRRELIGSNPSQDAILSEDSSCGALVSTDKHRSAVRRKRREEKRKEVQDLYDEWKREEESREEAPFRAPADAPEPDLPAENKGSAGEDEICFGLINEWRGESAEATKKRLARHGEDSVLYHDLRMVNAIQESVPNPFQKWMTDEEGESDENQEDSTFIVAVHVWISVIWHFLLGVVQYIYLGGEAHCCVIEKPGVAAVPSGTALSEEKTGEPETRPERSFGRWLSSKLWGLASTVVFTIKDGVSMKVQGSLLVKIGKKASTIIAATLFVLRVNQPMMSRYKNKEDQQLESWCSRLRNCSCWRNCSSQVIQVLPADSCISKKLRRTLHRVKKSEIDLVVNEWSKADEVTDSTWKLWVVSVLD